MGSRKLIFIIALQLVLEGCRVFSQYIQGAQTCTCASPGAIIPAGQFVIPAIIKPILQPDVAVQNTAPAVPSYPGDFSGFGGFPGFPGGFPGSFPGGFPGGYPGGFSGGYPGGFPGGLPGGFPGPYGGMPPIIFEDDDDRSSTWLYWLILALSRRGRFGGGNFGYGDSYGYGCGGGNYGNCGGCGGGYGGNGCGCGNCANGGGYGGCNGVGFGGFGGFSGNNCGCGNGCTYIPYPVPVPCGSSISGYPNFECPTDENVPNPGNQQPTEINVIFRNSDQQPQ